MVLVASKSTKTTWALSQIESRDGVLSHPPHSSPPLPHFQRDSSPLPQFSSSRISPAVLFIIVVLAIIFFISGLLHLLVRFLIKQHASSTSSQSNRYPETVSSSTALQRQLQQLFHLHDSGLDQALIDALPVFLYKEILGPKEPFDCAVCLCEFSPEERLRLLPLCSHAFHLNCIDTWLLSNSTCPLCRGTLFVPGVKIENPVFEFSSLREEEGLSNDCEGEFSLPVQKSVELEEGIAAEKRVLPVRLGKFRRFNNGNDVGDGNVGCDSAITNGGREVGETSSSNLDARRCYSMGSYQYVVGESKLQVELCRDGKGVRGRGLNGNSTTTEGVEGKRLSVGSKGESFSVSKIWLWSNKKGKFPISSGTSSLDGRLAVD